MKWYFISLAGLIYTSFFARMQHQIIIHIVIQYSSNTAHKEEEKTLVYYTTQVAFWTVLLDHTSASLCRRLL